MNYSGDSEGNPMTRKKREELGMTPPARANINVRLSLDEKTYRRLKLTAARRDMSMAALSRQLVEDGLKPPARTK